MSLTAAEVVERQRAGQVNRLPSSECISYVHIFVRNLVTLFNALVVPAAIALFFLDEYRGAIAVSSMAVLNTIIGLSQELWAKRQLDRLTLLTETTAQVIRDGQMGKIAAGDVVRDDRVCLTPGAVVVADGPVLVERYLEVDEALLTGESEPVRRRVGERVRSGGFCVAGEGTYRAEGVGAAAGVNQTAAQARRYRGMSTPLTRVINDLVKVLSYAAAGLSALYFGLYWLGRFPQTEMVQMVAATITSMVPQGLVLTATVAFTLGAVRVTILGAIDDPVVTGDQLAMAADPAKVIRTRSLFGRILPEQKVQIVQALQQQGHRVAMIGDGINDVLPIKWADLGIAMGAGSQASRTVAALVRANNDFALLPETLAEGRTIVRNLRRSCKLFLVKNVYSLRKRSEPYCCRL
jgi:cation-transporting ATPase E